MKQRLILTLVVLALILYAVADILAADSTNVYSKPEGAYIIIKGTAVDTEPDSFSLNFGKGTITVKAGGLKWYSDNFDDIEGHRVTVYGKVDDELYETKTIKAESMYNEDLAIFFFARSTAVDYDYWVVEDLIPGATIVQGTVTRVFGRKFTLDTGPRMLTVDTVTMAKNPLGEKSLQKIEEGDYVRVRGNMDYDFWQSRRLMADSIITLMEE